MRAAFRSRQGTAAAAASASGEKRMCHEAAQTVAMGATAGASLSSPVVLIGPSATRNTNGSIGRKTARMAEAKRCTAGEAPT